MFSYLEALEFSALDLGNETACGCLNSLWISEVF